MSGIVHAFRLIKDRGHRPGAPPQAPWENAMMFVISLATMLSDIVQDEEGSTLTAAGSTLIPYEDTGNPPDTSGLSAGMRLVANSDSPISLLLM